MEIGVFSLRCNVVFQEKVAKTITFPGAIFLLFLYQDQSFDLSASVDTDTRYRYRYYRYRRYISRGSIGIGTDTDTQAMNIGIGIADSTIFFPTFWTYAVSSQYHVRTKNNFFLIVAGAFKNGPLSYHVRPNLPFKKIGKKPAIEYR